MTANGNDMRGEKWRILCGSAAKRLVELPDASIDCCVTSPPYWCLRDYGVEGQLGLEPTPAEYVARMVEVFREVRRVLKDDGTLWLNLGDSYAAQGGGKEEGQYEEKRVAGATWMPRRSPPAGLKPKDLVGIPWRVAFALQADGWYLRSDIIWSKPNPMPESVTDRPTKAHEYLFLLSKSAKYYYNADAIAEPTEPESWHKSDFRRERNVEIHPSTGMGERDARGDSRNKRSVWTIPTQPFPGAHFAVMPEALARPCVIAGCPPGGTVLDPFTGSGTVCRVAVDNNCQFVGTELKPDYVRMAAARMAQDAFAFDVTTSEQS